MRSLLRRFLTLAISGRRDRPGPLSSPLAVSLDATDETNSEGDFPANASIASATATATEAEADFDGPPEPGASPAATTGTNGAHGIGRAASPLAEPDRPGGDVYIAQYFARLPADLTINDYTRVN